MMLGLCCKSQRYANVVAEELQRQRLPYIMIQDNGQVDFVTEGHRNKLLGLSEALSIPEVKIYSPLGGEVQRPFIPPRKRKYKKPYCAQSQPPHRYCHHKVRRKRR